jgi:sialate O-acetylesterase
LVAALRTAGVGLFLSLIGWVTPLQAELTIAPLFTDSAVVQRDTVFPVWGWAEPGMEVTVSFLEKTAQTRADAAGNWIVRLGPFAGNRVSEMAVTTSDREEIKLRDVVTGEVWLCAGQSNMQMPLKFTEGAEREIGSAHVPDLRQFKVRLQISPAPQSRVEGHWQTCTSVTAGDFSAVAYYFARQLAESQQVPVGIINCTKGGAPIGSWLSEAARSTPSLGGSLRERWSSALARQLKDTRPRPVQTISALGPFDPDELPMSLVGPGGYGEPGALFGGMVYGLIPYGIRGVAWYQGEADTSNTLLPVEKYGEAFRALIADWRLQWSQPNLPFLFVQLPANNVKGRDPTGESWATVRAGQAEAATLPFTGMVVTIDLGEADLMHPTRKRIVGERLARSARALIFHKSLAHAVSPQLEKVERVEEGLRLSFAPHETVLATREGGAVAGIEVQDGAGIYRPAVARLNGSRMTVLLERGLKVSAVRYAWRQDPSIANLTDGGTLPVAPFRVEHLP